MDRWIDRLDWIRLDEIYYFIHVHGTPHDFFSKKTTGGCSTDVAAPCRSACHRLTAIKKSGGHMGNSRIHCYNG